MVRAVVVGKASARQDMGRGEQDARCAMLSVEISFFKGRGCLCMVCVFGIGWKHTGGDGGCRDLRITLPAMCMLENVAVGRAIRPDRRSGGVE
jgi:hypothetical protein